MIFSYTLATAFLAFCASAVASNLPDDHILWGLRGKPNTLVKRQASKTSATVSPTPVADKGCSNGALTRSCWGSGYSITTDFDMKWPSTNKVRQYDWEITNTTCAPDGISRTCLLVNGQYPGPTIFADWGDIVEVRVKNSLQNNGTGIHWHGIRQLNTNSQDGANGLTECPLTPGDTKTYRWQATQHGSSWYHSHYTVQYGDGIVGPIQINGPATSNYDIDLGTYPITDWFNTLTSFQFLERANVSLQRGAGPPPGDTILINGTNKNPSGGGKYSKVTLAPGKKHRLRFINTSVEASLRVSLDKHNFTVISSDFVAVKPFVTDQLLLLVGQRYDVIVTANQAPGNYWFRAQAAADCATPVNNPGRAVFSYNGASVADPTTTGTTFSTTCKEPTGISPWWPTTIPSSDFKSQAQVLPVDLAIPNVTTNGGNIVAWTVDLTAIAVDWSEPTLQYVINRNTNYPKTYNMIEIPNQGTWTYWIIQEPPTTPVAIPHPIHLHGHDFWVLGTGSGVFDPVANFTSLNFDNPTRRDVSILPAAGWTVLAFPADNPGSWLMHCHISTHISAGLGVQFLESKDQIPLPDAAWDTTCKNWRSYYSNVHEFYLQDDSGL